MTKTRKAIKHGKQVRHYDLREFNKEMSCQLKYGSRGMKARVILNEGNHKVAKLQKEIDRKSKIKIKVAR